MAEIKTILCPTDFSPSSRRAIDEVAALARTFDAELCVLHVCPLLLYAIAPDAHPDAPTFEADVKKKLREELDALAAELRAGGTKVQTLLVDGNPGHVIAEVARDRKLDLIAMATHGRTGAARVLLGSVAERVVRTATVPVLTLRGQSDG